MSLQKTMAQEISPRNYKAQNLNLQASNEGVANILYIPENNVANRSYKRQNNFISVAGGQFISSNVSNDNNNLASRSHYKSQFGKMEQQEMTPDKPANNLTIPDILTWDNK